VTRTIETEHPQFILVPQQNTKKDLDKNSQSE
jgi:hypothetical protein